MIDGKNIFKQPVKDNLRKIGNIRKITMVQGDEYTTVCQLDYLYFKEYLKIIAIDLSKQQALDAVPKAMQQINFTGNLDRPAVTTILFIIEESKENILDFSQETVRVLQIYFALIKYQY